MIEFKDFCKDYGSQKKVVHDVSLVAKPGNITGLLGVNGSGKTTLIKAACALHYASSGKVFVSDSNENLINVEENPESAKKNIGYVPETLSFPEFMTVKEYLFFMQNCYATKKDTKKTLLENFEETVNLCALEDVLSKKIGALSKGYRQRLSFAKALIHNPKNIILDEPMNGLDPVQITQFREIILKAAKEKTILISTHLMQEVSALCSYIYIISKGTIAAAGTESELLTKTQTHSMEKAFLMLTEGSV